MNRSFLFLSLLLLLGACSSSQQGTIAELRKVELEIKKERISGGLDKAIASYEEFLEETSGAEMTPEAIRRLADLKVEKEYGLLGAPHLQSGPSQTKKVAVSQPSAETGKIKTQNVDNTSDVKSRSVESDKKRPTAVTPSTPVPTETEEAVALYLKLLEEYPEYAKNDQALYQLSRAYEEQGKVDEAMQIMSRLIETYPDSHYLDEVYFRRGEYFFSRRKYLDAEIAYGSVVAYGEKSEFYLLSLYKLGWSFYKQDLYEEALHKFISLLDHMVANGYDLDKVEAGQDGKRIRDTLQIVSQCYSDLGGVKSVVKYFAKYGRKGYEYVIYANLAEYYFGKDRYNDAVLTYRTFIERNPYHFHAPLYALREIAINKKGGFASLVIAAKTGYARDYGFGAGYWKYNNPDDRPDVVAGLKANLIDLANHYHALYQKKKFAKNKKENLKQALHWYREYLDSFPVAPESAELNYQLAELLLETNSYAEAAREYEKTAYSYPVFDKADKAGYAAVYAYRQHLKEVSEEEKESVTRDVIRASIQFAQFYPKHKKAAVVLSAAVDDLYALREYKSALHEGQYLLQRFPKITREIRRSALLVVAHSSFELGVYRDAENAYTEVLQLIPETDKSRKALIDNLVVSIYKQGEAANRAHNYKKAAEHFLRVAAVAPLSKLRATADYDGAAALIKVEEWPGAIAVLTGFRTNFPKHKLQHDVTKKLAFVYEKNGQFALAAKEYERIESESKDPALRQEALLSAAELYAQIDALNKAVEVYRRYINAFPEPIDISIEVHDKLAGIYKRQGEQKLYYDTLRTLVSMEAVAGSRQTTRTRQIAGAAALILARDDYEQFVQVRLVKPFKVNLERKQTLMKKATEAYTQLFDYEDGTITSEATFHLAEIYADFSRSLLDSERPVGLNALESEQYELALEEQAYPFEEKAIEMHQSNLDLMAQDIYTNWIETSLERLAAFMPARYAKLEVESVSFASASGFRFENKELFDPVKYEAGRAERASNNKKKTDGGKELAR